MRAYNSNNNNRSVGRLVGRLQIITQNVRLKPIVCRLFTYRRATISRIVSLFIDYFYIIIYSMKKNRDFFFNVRYFFFIILRVDKNNAVNTVYV